MASNSFSPAKRVKVSSFSANEKVIIINVFNYLKFQNPDWSVDHSVEVCSNMTGVSKTSVYNIRRQEKSSDLRSEPASSSGRKKRQLTDDEKTIIRRKVHSFYFNKEIPTLEKIILALREDESAPQLSKTQLHKVLHELNFCWEKFNRKSILIDKQEIVCWRRKYLREMKKLRSEARTIFYLDETWITEGHTVSKFWQDKNVISHHQAVQEAWSTGLKPPSGKGRRLIITHIGSVNGFVEGGLLVFESKRTVDYHEEMNADVFEEYFQQMVTLLPTGSVVVMDNASYHSRRAEKLPTTAWKKIEILNWLKSKNIEVEENLLKRELLEKANQHKPQFVNYIIDEFCAARGIQVLRLPPYHCELNPIELVWAQVKGEVARKNKTYKLSDVKNLLICALNNVSAEKWKKCEDHVIKEEQRMWELDGLVEETTEPFIITFSEGDSSSESNEELI